jgi:hypothetical protein
MKDRPSAEPLRGDAAWRAQKDAINKRNDAARAAGAARRARADERDAKQRSDAARTEASNLPVQPEP